MSDLKSALEALAQVVTTNDKLQIQEAFKVLSLEMLSTEFSFDGLDFFISDIEFASSALKDTLHEKAIQKTLGRVYIFRYGNGSYKRGNYAGLDITCGNGNDFGTILIRGITRDGLAIKGPGNVLNALIRNERLPDNNHKYKIVGEQFDALVAKMDGKSFLEVFVIKGKDKAKIEQVSIGRRTSITGKKNDDQTDDSPEEISNPVQEISGCLLRAVSVASETERNKLSVIPVQAPNDEESESEISIRPILEALEEDPDEEWLEDLTIGNDNSDVKPSRTFVISKRRFESLVNRAFELRLDYFVYYKKHIEDDAAVEVADFVDFQVSEQIRVRIFADFCNRDILKKRNLDFKKFAKGNKKKIKEMKRHFRSEFVENLTFAEFKNDFFFADQDFEKRFCGYCGVSENEINSLFHLKKIYTKRQYSRGRSLEVDKINPDETYHKGNIILACYWCNNAKTDEFSFEEFKTIAPKVRAVWTKRLGGAAI